MVDVVVDVVDGVRYMDWVLMKVVTTVVDRARGRVPLESGRIMVVVTFRTEIVKDELCAVVVDVAAELDNEVTFEPLVTVVLDCALHSLADSAKTTQMNEIELPNRMV